MSSIQSLGLHEPSALPYLIAESILPPDPSPALYSWTIFHGSADRELDFVEEEILTTKHCAVWSRNGMIKRVFNLTVEGEQILQAFITSFSSKQDQDGVPSHTEERTKKDEAVDRGLVVVLKTQAHIFLLSGDGYVIPLSFEVESAFPFPSGFMLQRKLAEDELHGQVAPMHQDLSTINETTTTIGGNSSRPSLVLPVRQPWTTNLESAKNSGMPRTFSFIQVMSELGLVVCSSLRKGEPLDQCKALPKSERILFVSRFTEFDAQGKEGQPPVCLALTLNEKTFMFTVWRVSSHVAAEEHDGDTRMAKSRSSIRKSSNIHKRDGGHAPQPSRRPKDLRESLGPPGQQFPEASPFPVKQEQDSLPVDDLAIQLGPEFGDVGVQTRSARRISSMLARTDLGSAADRTTFNDIAMGHSGRHSLNRAVRRGESLGGVNDRQSFGLRRRSSFPTNTSAFSGATSFLDISARGLLDEMDPLRKSTLLEEETLDNAASDLPRDIGFFRVNEFPRQQTHEGIDVPIDVKVVTLKAYTTLSGGQPKPASLYLCVLDKSLQELSIVRVWQRTKAQNNSERPSSRQEPVELKCTLVRRISKVKDICKVGEGDVQRMIILTESRNEGFILQLEAPWSPSFRIGLPPRFAIYDPFTGSQYFSPRKDKDTGSRRIIPATEVQIRALHGSAARGRFYAVDQDRRRHALQLRLAPADPLVLDILKMCDIVLGTDQRESLLIAFWEVSRWLEVREPSANSEWVVMIIVLFSLAIPFINSQNPNPSPSQRRKKGALLRSSSGSAVDLTNYEAMHYEEHDMTMYAGIRGPAWNWLLRKHSNHSPTTFKSKSARMLNTTSSAENVTDKKSPFLAKCVVLAKEYTQSPAGESALGPEGYLPTSINREREQRCNAVPSILLGLHVLYEESKLNVTSNIKYQKSQGNLVTVMAQLGYWLQWRDWTAESGTYYEFESSEANKCLYDQSLIDGLSMPGQPFPPSSIYEYIEQCICGNPPPQFLTLDTIIEAKMKGSAARQWYMAELTPRTLALLTFLYEATNQAGSERTIQTLSKSGMTECQMKTLPDGVAAAFCQALASKKRATSGNLGPDRALSLLKDRETPKSEIGGHASRPHVSLHHDALRDYHSICNSALEAESLQRWDASSEADRHAITRLIFSKDRRFPEASKLVNQTRPPVVECTPEPEWTEVELLEAQKELAQHVTRRTLSVAAGRGMMHFNARVPLLTERVPIPAFSLQCIMKPRNATESTQAMTFSADKATFTEEKVCWAFFHNGASMGLMISNDAQGIDTSWILYNKPPELTNRHAGFLLALGLNGHLKTLAKWVAFKYLTPKHTMTSVGLLLGLSVSSLGTMDTLVTRLLSVHVTRLLPPGAAELNLSPLTQTTGIMGIGLLYYGSQHRRMSEVMLSEIENNDPEEGAASDTVLRDEGYRLAAGFSLGLINLGQGKRLHGLHDMNVVERLLSIAVGTKNVNMVHVLDRATAGAVMAIAFIFLKTNDEAIASKVDVPDTLHQFDYVRPDIFLLRTLARHLIMWDSMVPTHDFVKASLPKPYRGRADLRSSKHLSTEDMPFLNIVAGICLAIALRFAGSQCIDARDLLISYLDQFLRLSRLPAHSYDARVTLNSVRNCLDTLALATASVMAGSGDLHVVRRLRALHGRTDKDTPFGSHLAAHMALGTLFLAGGTKTFGTSKLAVASLCIAFYPLFPNDVLDNSGHLQALRHLWVLATEARCLVPRDGDAGGSVVGGVSGTIYLKDGTTKTIPLPGLIPEFNTIKSVQVKGEGFWDAVLELNDKQLQDKIKAENGVNVVLRRRAAYDRPSRDLFNAELQALSEVQGIPSVDPNAVAGHVHGGSGLAGVGVVAHHSPKQGNPFGWVFELDSFKDFDHAERALVLGPTPVGEWNVDELLQTTVVDSRLELEKDVLLPDQNLMEKDKLWQLRLLFAWFDRWERDDEQIGDGNDDEIDNKWFSNSGGTWWRREVIERLRWRVWNMTTTATQGSDDDQ
ncbi:anaphase-promoting complex component APC1 [Exophiala viscosa]|uniref:Anaphase-promoting complex component APC1 n=1 Tax=Exophiala viscosa TaxID=2486360 RepID=A0AAN6DPD9_9EURO|nr:anaphase-promoting complex component APC1 [Exophiala viscosa]